VSGAALAALLGAGQASAQAFVAEAFEAPASTASEVPCSSLPPAGSAVRVGDLRCGDRGSYVELPASTVACLRSATRQHLLDLFRKGELRPGAAASPAQAELRLRTRSVAVRQYAWPVWVEAATSGAQPYAGCAAGLALPSEVRVSLREGELRARRMVAWETANSLLAWALDRADLGDDGKVVEAAASSALDSCSALPYAGN
jgi:hypothetical protein